jgi:hypothetical protein
VNVSASPKLVVYVLLAGIGLLVGLLAGQPDLVALALPFSAIAAYGITRAPARPVWVIASLDRERALTGEQVRLDLVLESSSPVRAELRPVLEPGLSLVEEQSSREVTLSAAEPAAV